MVTLLGVRLMGWSRLGVSEDCDEMWAYGGVVGALGSPGWVGEAPNLSADMLL